MHILQAMNNNSIKELDSKLRDLSAQWTYTEEALEKITQESAQVEYMLRVAQFAARREVEVTRTIRRPDEWIKKIHIDDLVRIINKYQSNKEGAEGRVTSVRSCYVQLKNDKIDIIYRKHWRNLMVLTTRTAQ